MRSGWGQAALVVNLQDHRRPSTAHSLVMLTPDTWTSNFVLRYTKKSTEQNDNLPFINEIGGANPPIKMSLFVNTY